MTRPITTAARLLAAAGLLAGARAQASGWVSGQVNTTMCTWEQLRASVVRDTLYLDGGQLWWLPGLSNGLYGTMTSDDNPLGIVYTLNFSVPFSLADNVTALLGQLHKAPEGSGANNLAPNYYDGAMLANDDEWFLYGGLLRMTAAYAPPDADAVQGYQADQYGATKPAFRPGFVNVDLPANVTRYVAYGGAANAPSENKAWYFSGLRAPDAGPIYTVSGSDALTAVNVSATLVELDMAVQQQETWANRSLPAAVPGRANPELVWVPVGAQGLLVALGGVVDPAFVTATGASEDPAASVRDSPAFLATIDVYDVAGKTWYRQPAAGGAALGQRTRACAVVATAADASSFNIYYYGGFDGLNTTVAAAFSDDVWVLSLPSFTWIRVAAGTPAHARAGHKCVAPYPDQMLVVGGYVAQTEAAAAAGGTAGCLPGNLVQLFNLSSAQWLSAYSPADWSAYAVPDAVVAVVGGGPHGGATATAPPSSAGGWVDAGLASVFATPYPTGKLTAYYPYPLNASSSGGGGGSSGGNSSSGGAGSNNNNNNNNSSHGLPSYVPPLLGVICGLAVVTAAAVGIVLFRRRLRRRRYGDSPSHDDGSGRGHGHGRARAASAAASGSAATYDTRRNIVFSWLRAQTSVKHPSRSSAAAAAASASAYGVTPVSPATGTPGAVSAVHSSPVPFFSPDYAASGDGASSFAGGMAPVEAGNTFIAEMLGDTAHRVELPSSRAGFDGDAQTEAKADAAALQVSSAALGSPPAVAADDDSTRGAAAVPDPEGAAAAAVPRPDSPSLGHVPDSPSPDNREHEAHGSLVPAPLRPRPARERSAGSAESREEDAV